MKDASLIYQDAKFMQFDLAKIGLAIFVFLVGVIPLTVIEVIVYKIFGLYLKFLMKLIGLLVISVMVLIVDLFRHEKRAREANIDYIKSLKATWLLVRMIAVNVDDSRFSVSADHNRQVKQNILRLASFVIVETKQTAAIFIAQSLNADTRRDLEAMNYTASDIARYLRLTASNYREQVWQVKRLGFKHIEKYSTQLLYY